MTKWMAVVAVAALLAGGCNQNKDTSGTSGDPKMMSTDACTHCPGNQTADAAGKCSACGAKAK